MMTTDNLRETVQAAYQTLPEPASDEDISKWAKALADKVGGGLTDEQGRQLLEVAQAFLQALRSSDAAAATDVD